MRILLDTNVALWLMDDVNHIPNHVRDILSDGENVLFLSAISVWEIYQKYAMRKLALPQEPLTVMQMICDEYDITPLPFQAEDAYHLPRLPGFHKDPFDRMLICQAIRNNLTIATSDKEIRQYPVATLW